MTLRVVVADDSVLVRRGVVALAELEDDVEVIGQADDEPQLHQLVSELSPDVVVTDIRMPPTNTTEGVDAALRIRREHPTVGVVVLSQHADPGYVSLLFREGMDGLAYLLKERVGDGDQLGAAMRSVVTGGTVVDPKLVHLLASDGPGGLSSLTPRETDVLASMAEGLNNAAIAERLVLSEKAVSKHIGNIFSKLGLTGSDGAHHRVKAVLQWLESR
ncbi:MAG: response regulator [Ilumatobacter sp.]